MNCRGVIQQLSDYLDGELDATVRAELERHLEHCDDCHLIVDETRKTIEIFCNSEPVALPEDVRGRLHAALVNRLRNRTA